MFFINYQYSFWISDASGDACIVGFIAVLVSVVIVAIGVGMIIWHRSSQLRNKGIKLATTNQIGTDATEAADIGAYFDCISVYRLFGCVCNLGSKSSVR